MKQLLASPRRRRRLAWVGAMLIVVAAAAAVIAAIPNGGRDWDADRMNAPAVEIEPPTTNVRLTREAKRAIDSTVQRFVQTAVARRDPGAAWELASAELRTGSTRADWARGDLPVEPYPKDALRSTAWRAVYEHGGAIGVDVTLFPKRGSGSPALVYAAELVPSQAKRRRWLVDSWVPLTTLRASSQPAAPAAGRARAERRAAAPRDGRAPDEGELGAEWFLVPAALLALIVLVPSGIVLASFVRTRRAERPYRVERRL